MVMTGATSGIFKTIPFFSAIGSSSEMRAFFLGTILLFALFLSGCPPMERAEPPDPTELPEYGLKLRNVHRRMLDDSQERTDVDRKIAEAVEQLGKTLWPDYKDTDIGRDRWRMGFLEVSDVDRRNVSRFHQYLTEKILTFSFLEPEITRNVVLVERFTVSDVWRTGSPPPHETRRDFHLRHRDRNERYRHRVSSNTEYRP
jgi:hypothetical protein